MRNRRLSSNRVTREEKQMNHRRFSALFISAMLPFILYGPEAASAKTEIKGAAILDHPCGKVAVKQMGLVHAGKMDDANKLSTKAMQDQWKAMPAKDRTMMSGMMKDMSQTEEQFSADIKANGVLVVDGQSATLTVQKKTKDASGTSTSTTTQEFKLDGGECLVSR
jgi:hypothetical protein